MGDRMSRSSVFSTGPFFEQAYYQPPPAPAPISLSCPQPVPAFPFPASSVRQNYPLDLIQIPPVSHTDALNASGNFAIDSDPVFLSEALESPSLPESDAALDWWLASMENILQVSTSRDE